MKRLVAVIIALLAARMSFAQPGGYNDVVVIVNSNSSSSRVIGEYFQEKRGIPEQNIVLVSCDTTEEVTDSVFTVFRSQIENTLTSRGIVNSINYLVTTKGVPLKVNRGNTFSQSSPSSSVEGELALILGPYASSIGGSGPQMSPYYWKATRFSRAEFGVYLVTRLDAFTVDDVKTLIDRSGPETKVPKDARFILDQDPSWWNGPASFLNGNEQSAYDSLIVRGRVAIFDTSAVYLTHQTSVVGYCSWGSNDANCDLYAEHAIPHNTWLPGSIAETFVSTSARTFTAPAAYGQSLIADLVSEGATGAKGYVYEPFASAIADVRVLFVRYVSGYTLAESYGMASRYLSWMDVVLGDPKTTIEGDPMPVTLVSFVGKASGGGGAVLEWKTASEVNNFGFQIERRQDSEALYVSLPNVFVPGHGTTIVPQSYAFADSTAAPGVWYYRLKQIDLDGTLHYSDAIRVEIGTTAVTEHVTANSFALCQNYPNPFNPVTQIAYRVAQSGHVELRVYTILGEEVATLVHEVQSAGEHSVRFDGTNLSSGTYLYRIETGSSVDVKRMILMK